MPNCTEVQAHNRGFADPLSPQRSPDISNNVGPVKLFLNTLLSFHLKEFFSFVLFRSLSCSFFSASTTMAHL
jgi:hypothetical protein